MTDIEEWTEWTEAQLAAIDDAIDNRKGCESMVAEEIAKLLRAEGHTAFAGAGEPAQCDGDPLGLGPPQGAEPSAPAEAPAREFPTAERHEVATEADNPWGGYDDDFENDLDASDQVIPRLKLKQSQTKDQDQLGVGDVPDGHWFHSSDPKGKSGPVRRLVALTVRKERAFLGPYGKAKRGEFVKLLDELQAKHGVTIPDEHTDSTIERGVICSSRDRQTPDKQPWGPGLRTSCAGCPEKEWHGRHRNCNESYVLPVFDVTEGFPGRPVLLHLHGKAIRPGKLLLSELKTRRRVHRRPVFGFVFEASSTEVREDNGNYYVPAFSRPEPIGDEVLRERPELVEFYASEAATFATEDGEQ